MCFTSPPYNAGVSAKLRGNTSIDDNLYRDEYNDNKSQPEWLDLIDRFTAIALEWCEYVFVNLQVLSGNKRSFIEYWHKYVDRFCDVAIWDKGHAAPQLARRVMDSRFEFVLMFSQKPTRQVGTREFRGMVHNVYDGHPQRHNEFAEVHAATFPVDFPQHFIETFSNPNEYIYDPFLGTGSTFVACENASRIGRGMEISPAYVAVCLERLAGMGLTPKRIDDGNGKAKRKTKATA